ncbi:PREDICTED: DDT domain-containing protein PTM-like [Tarenaya hassleriana]|uniref:DDT domain-containing protein PTM-like n=1 Tax=Tarenaya hassleriana TaxID=28532 RepID=UPI0008FD86C8|nr:PREDICTED: DDT domain-containing protein PTM-like [Tarenaya hassleriana]
MVGVEPRVGQRPKKRARVAMIRDIRRGDSGGKEERLRNEVKPLKNVDLNYGFVENTGISERFGANLSGNVDLNCGPDETLGGKCASGTDLNEEVGDLTTGFDLNSNKELGLIHVNIDHEENLSEKRSYIDLNLDANGDLDEVGGSALDEQKREQGFDLNLEIDVENNKAGMDVQINGNSADQEPSEQDYTGFHNYLENGEFKEAHVAKVTHEQLIEEIQMQNSVSGQEFYTPDSNGVSQKDDPSEHRDRVVDESQSDRGNSYELRNGQRKRIKVLDNSNFMTETVLRRSTRRMSSRTRVTPTSTTCLLDEVCPSPAVSGQTEVEHLIVNTLLNQKPQLPPSSRNLSFKGLPLLDIFSVYSCLRSFSTLLFLSPFELEDFVEALRCVSPSLLFDSIHVSVLQILRKHLEQVAAEGDLSASYILRSLDWDMLDLVTYPLFLVEYLLFRGSDHGPVFDLGRLNFFRKEYFKQSVTLKIEILRRLCDDMIDVEAVRSELNRRSLAPEFEMELDRSMNTDTRRRRRSIVELGNDLSLNAEVIDVSSDWNSDECCLCKMDGSLLCCDGCPAAYHSKCVGVASHLLPEGDWYCPECSFDRRRPGLKPGRLVRGAEYIETDPHGRQYYSSCGYLLVIETDGSGSLNYYDMNDENRVVEVLKLCGSLYKDVVNAINKHWDIPVGSRRTISSVNPQMSASVDGSAEGTIPSTDGSKAVATSPAPEVKTATAVEGMDGISILGHSDNRHLKSSRKLSDSTSGLDIRKMSSEGSAEMMQNGSGSSHEEAPSSNLDIMKEQEKDSHLPSNNFSRINTRKGNKLEMQSEKGYRNCYIFARMTSLIAGELLHKLPIHSNEVKSDEDIISIQLKTILMNSNKFHWGNIQSMYLDAWKETCGWCFSCKNPSEGVGNEMDCLFNMSLGPVRGLHESEMASIKSNNKNSHLLAVMCQIISMENRLRGLLTGPWSDPQYSRIWRDSILNASNTLGLKLLLLKLEESLHYRVLSSEWLNHVDFGMTMGSAIHIVTASTCSLSKRAIDKRRGRMRDPGVKHTTKTDVGLTMCWWRGGRLSRQLFNWKVLPQSLVLKAAKQGGSRKIPGIFYPENSDPPRRSRRVAWQAAVGSCTTSEQLGLQVRELDSYIKWVDIENTHLLPALDKESKKYVRLFKKAIVRRKSLEAENVKYLLDFGKRRNIPDVVLKNGCMAEESSSGRKKFWLNEMHVPLHLLKGFEEKKIARKTGKATSFRRSEVGKARKRSSEQKGFLYLFARAERSESSQCAHCNKDVLLSESVCCYICKGYFHKKHVRKADGEECSYICHQCRGEILAKEQPMKRKRGRPPGSFRRKSFGLQTQKHKKVTPTRKSSRVKKTKISVAEKISLRLQNHKKVVTSLSLRRSTRRRKHVFPLQDESKPPALINKKQKPKPKRGRGRPKKVKREIPLIKKRTKRLFSYWLNGLLLSRKPGDERVAKFQGDRYFIPSENSDTDNDIPKCHICASSESASSSALIACEICGGWFHGEAYGLNEEKSDMLIGFRCHICRKQSPPECPHP